MLAAVESTDCTLRLLRLDRPSTPVRVKSPGLCPGDGDQVVDDVWLSRASIAAEAYDSPSPHGEAFSIYLGPRPAGPLRIARGEWSWTDSEPPCAFGAPTWWRRAGA